jgi:hypothetical protein
MMKKRNILVVDDSHGGRRSGVITGHAGVFWVAAKLSWLGEIVGLAMNNALGIDLTASDRIGSRVVALQVKSSRKRYNFWFCKAPPKGSKIIYVFVQPVRGSADELEAYVVPAKEVKVGYGGAKNPQPEGPSGQTYFHLFHRGRSSVARYRNRWDLITGNPQHRPVVVAPDGEAKPEALGGLY